MRRRGQTCVELCTLSFALAGLVVGATVGARHYGILGALAGGVCGFLAGLLFCVVMMVCLAGILILSAKWSGQKIE